MLCAPVSFKPACAPNPELGNAIATPPRHMVWYGVVVKRLIFLSASMVWRRVAAVETGHGISHDFNGLEDRDR